MDKFLEKYNLPKVCQEAAESLKSYIMANEIDEVINLPANKSQSSYSLTGKYYKTFKKI